MKRFLLTVAITLLASPVLAQFKHSAAVCVQQQLNKLELDAGEESGLLGEETQAAFERLQEQRGRDRFRLELSLSNAIVICRELGVENWRLRAFWPSRTDNVATDFHPAIDRPLQDALKTTAVKAIERLRDLFGVRLADTINILAAADEKSLHLLWEKHKGPFGDSESFKSAYDFACAQHTGGFVYQKNLVICIEDEDLRVAEQNRPSIDHTIFHEIFHAAQFQLTGHKVSVTPEQKLQQRGPEWMIEGTADYFAIRSTFFVDHLTPFFSSLREQIGGPAGDLSAYELSTVRETDSRGLYDQGVYAVHVLARTRGDKSIVEFYRNIGLGMTWKDAFKKSFGTRVEEFYEEYASEGTENSKPD